MGFLIFLGIVVALGIGYIVAVEFATIAGEKGYDNPKYFWYTFLFGMVGILMVVALPDRRKNIGKDKKSFSAAKNSSDNIEKSENKKNGYRNRCL